MLTLLLSVSVVAGLIVTLMLAARAAGAHAVREHPQYAAVQGAILTLLALMLGFSFSSAMSRFSQREEVIAHEANAIQTSYLRAGLLNPPEAERLRAALRVYAEERLKLVAPWPRDEAPLGSRLREATRALWAAADQGVRQRPELAYVILNPVNEIMDQLSIRDSLVHRHTPTLVLVVISASAAASLAVVGLGLGSAERRVKQAAWVMGAIVAATLWITIDLDHPRIGLIRVDDAPLRDVIEAMSMEP